MLTEAALSFVFPWVAYYAAAALELSGIVPTRTPARTLTLTRTLTLPYPTPSPNPYPYPYPSPGIVAILFCGLFMAEHTRRGFSPEAAALTSQALAAWLGSGLGSGSGSGSGLGSGSGSGLG